MSGFRVAIAAMLAVAFSLPATGPAPAVRTGSAAVIVRFGTFHAYLPGGTAVTYDPARVPAGGRATVVELSTQSGTLVTLTLKGLLPNRDYGAHVHTARCGPNPADAGPHFQDLPDPHQPSTDPRYTNPRNEIWLDLHTDAAGNGHAMSTVDWVFAGRQARSVVVHEHHTRTGDGAAGARLACLNVGFR
ncbi:MAG: superoxide dismutase family protein [Labedaea sp.]